MKNTKLTRIFVLILSLALLVGSVIGIAASAEEADNTYDIAFTNIVHGDMVQVLIAVDAPTGTQSNIEVTYKVGNGRTRTATYYKDITINGKAYPVFFTAGIAAKDCGETILAEAHVKDTTPATRAYRNVCVAEYLYSRLYKDGFMFKAEADDGYDSKLFYLDMLEYIASAQQVLWNNKVENADKQRTLVTDMVYAYALNGSISSNGNVIGASGFVNGAVTVAYTGGEENHAGWYIKTAEGTELVFGNQLLITKSASITPYFDGTIINFNSTAVDTGLSIDLDVSSVDANGKYSKVIINKTEAALPGEISLSYLSNTDNTVARIPTGGTHILVKQDSNGENYLSYKNVSRTTYHAYSSDQNGSGYRADAPSFFIPITELGANPNVTVFELDMNVPGDSSETIAQIIFGTFNDSYSRSNLAIYPYLKTSSKSSNITVYDTRARNAIASFAKDTRVKLRYEYYWSEGVVQFYLNNEYVGSSTEADQKHQKPNAIQFGADSSSTVEYNIYSISAKNVEKAYNPTPSLHETFAPGGYEKIDYTWQSENDTYLQEIADGKYSPEYTTENGSTHTFNGTYFEFDNGITIDHSVGYNKSTGTVTSPDKYTNVHGASASVKTDSSGNTYINLYSPSRISNCDRAYALNITPKVFHNESVANRIYVYEVDLRVDSLDGKSGAPFQLFVRSSGGTVQYNFDSSTKTGLYMNGANLGDWDVWNSLRFEIYQLEDDARIMVYRKNAEGVYEHIHTWADSSEAKYPLSNIKAGSTINGIGISVMHPASIDIDNIAFYTDIKEYAGGDTYTFVYTKEGNELLPNSMLNDLVMNLNAIDGVNISFKNNEKIKNGDSLINAVYFGKNVENKAGELVYHTLLSKATEAYDTAAADAKAEIEKETYTTNTGVTLTKTAAGYYIYVDAATNSVAVYWDDFRVCEAAIAKFEELFVTEEGLNIEAALESEALTKVTKKETEGETPVEVIDYAYFYEIFTLEDYLAERGEMLKAEAWEELAKQLPAEYSAEIVEELKKIYDLYTDGIITWMASLYTPIGSNTPLTDKYGNYIDIYGNYVTEPVYPAKGGFYNSMSAKEDTTGWTATYGGATHTHYYSPDIENSYVGLSLLEGYGMAEMFGGSWAKATPEWLAQAVCAWYYDLQDYVAIGDSTIDDEVADELFFYNPQWPKEYVEANGLQSRITRDRGTAKNVLSQYKNVGYIGFYTKAHTESIAPVESTVAAASYMLTDRLMYSSAAFAVSKVVAVSSGSELDAEYRSLEAFQTHLNEYRKIANTYIANNNYAAYASNFYSWGNEFQSMTGYMTDEMKEELYNFFSEYQDSASGAWIIPGSSFSYLSYGELYDVTNAIHKIGSVHNSIGKPLAHTEKMIDAALTILAQKPTYNKSTGEGESASATAIYNAWSALPYVYSNVINYSEDTLEAREKTVDGYKKLVYAEAGRLIEISRLHIELCKHDNGAFSYGPAYQDGLTTSQGCPAGTGVKEPDMNGNGIATVSFMKHLLGGLDVDEFMPPIFTEAERNLYVQLLEYYNEGDVYLGGENQY